jgi:hypothetical protein
LKWALRLFPKGTKKLSNNPAKVLVPVSLVLLDGNGSNYVKVDWKKLMQMGIK